MQNDMIGVPQVSLTLLNPAQGHGSQKVPQILTPSRVGLLDRTSDEIRMGPVSAGGFQALSPAGPAHH